MSQPLELRYQWLLRAYPAAYRRDRGAEMIGTLMEAAGPEQRRPTVREAVALILRGLQARAGANRPRSQAETWVGALRLAVLLLLTFATAASLAHTGKVITDFIAEGELGFRGNVGHPLGTVLAAAALVAVARGRYAWGLLAAVGATATLLGTQILALNTTVELEDGRLTYAFNSWSLEWVVTGLAVTLGENTMWAAPLAALMIMPLLRWGKATAGRPLAWLLAVPPAVVILPTAYDVTIGLQPWGLIAVVAGFLLWVAVDARGTIASSALFLPLILAPLNPDIWPGWVTGGGVLGTSGYWACVGAAAILLAAGALRARTQSRL